MLNDLFRCPTGKLQKSKKKCENMKYLLVNTVLFEFFDIFDCCWGNFDRPFMPSTPFINNQDQIQPLQPVNSGLMEDRLSWKWKPERFFFFFLVAEEVQSYSGRSGCSEAIWCRHRSLHL